MSVNLKLYRSNRLELLVDQLSAVLTRLVRDPLAGCPIVVPGSGIDLWLSMQLALRFGVWANPDFPFPRNYFERLFAAAGLPAEKGERAYQPHNLMWAVAAELSSLLPRPEFEPVRSYLEQAGAEDLRTPDGQCSVAYIALCRRIADLFDHYVVYRPQWIHRWEAGFSDADDWQAILWRAVVQRLGPIHFAALAKQWVERLRGDAARALPPATLVFGATHLPPLYVHLLGELARYSEVHLFVPSPSPEYWAELRSRKQLWREQLHNLGRLQVTEADLRAHEGNPVLASLGTLGGRFQAVLEACLVYEEVSAYDRPAQDTALHVLQADVFDLCSRPGEDAPPLPLKTADFSLRVHCCHSRLRELEILRDQVRALLERDPTLQPEDILVLCPDMDAYAPLVDAVFGSDRDDPRHIPYSIADRAPRNSDPAIAAYFTVLELLRGRMSVNELFGVLACEPVRECFGITALDVERARNWLSEVGVRWGIDGRHRRAFGYPEFDEHSWSFALRRLLLGVAMPPDPGQLFAGVSPYPEAESEGAEFAGKLAELCNRLFALRPILDGVRSVPEWGDMLDRVRREFLADSEVYAFAHRQLREIIGRLSESANGVGFDGRVPFEAVLSWVSAALEERASAFGFLRGGVNFCSLRITRCVPARVVCVVGMNDGAYPRSEPEFPMNRAAARREAGDPNRREEDRFLFLQALLSAREHFLVTYAGRDIRNNSERPPAVVVEELLDTVDRTFVAPAQGVRPRDVVLVRHPLQPFSPRYFSGDPNLVSFSAALCEGARRLGGTRFPPRKAVQNLLPEPQEQVVTVEELARWIEHAPFAFLRRRLGVYFEAESEALEDELPIQTEGLLAWKIGTQILELRSRGVAAERTYDVLRAMGLLPPGRLGRLHWQRVSAMAEPLWEKVQELTRGPQYPVLDVDLRLGTWTLAGTLRGLWPAGQVLWSYSRVRANVMARAWVRHLALCAALDATSLGDIPPRTFLVGRSERDVPRVVEFLACPEAVRLLEELVALYGLGLRYPLPFAAEAAAKYLDRLASGKPEAEARSHAEQELRGSWVQPLPERYLVTYLLLYRMSEPGLDDLEGDMPETIPSFSRLARAILAPMERYARPWQPEAEAGVAEVAKP
ncbi:MAG: RecBCD enzyme subunit RecC [Candidatus Binatia bacterium]|nr:MAG: RecBCD enzyme subunit RecC [Candidatus Binatia bacterium]